MHPKRRWPITPPDSGNPLVPERRNRRGPESQGVQLATTGALAHYWATDYDAQDQAKLQTTLPQFIAEIDGLDIHFVQQYA